MGQNHKCPGYNYWKNQGESISSMCRHIPSTTIASAGQLPCNTCQWNELPRAISLLNVLWHPLISQCTRLCDVPRTHNVDLPTQYRLNVEPASQPIANSMRVNHIWRWPNIETKLGDCPLFALTVIRVTFYPLKATTWITPYIGPTVIMLGHRLRRWTNIIATKTL